MTASDRRGHASAAQSPNARSVRQPRATFASGSTHRNVPLRPKCPIGARRVARACPVRILRVAQLEPEAPVVRLLPPEARQHADETGELHRARFLERLRRDSCRLAQLAGEHEQIVERSLDTRARRAGEDGGRVPPHVREVLGERHRRPLGDQRGRDLEAVVRVDAPRAGTRDRRTVVERQARRVREQMAKRRSRRARGFVEVDDPLLRGDEHRDCRRELRHRRPRKPSVPVAHRSLGSARDADCGVLTRPPLDLAQRVHEPRD